MELDQVIIEIEENLHEFETYQRDFLTDLIEYYNKHGYLSEEQEKHLRNYLKILQDRYGS